MEQHLKQRLLGLVVLIATAVIVLPLLLDGAGYRALQDIKIEAPQRPPFRYQQDGFTAPLRDLDDRDLLNAPPPVEVKEFNKSMDDDAPEEQDKQPLLEASDSPPPAVPAESAATWVVQVGSFSVEANAMTAREKLAAMNTGDATVEIETEKVDGQDVYVVKVVSNDYESVSKITELIKKDYPDAFIKERE